MTDEMNRALLGQYQPPFHELPDGRYEILMAVDRSWWAQAMLQGGVWKTPIGRFRASETDGVVAVRKAAGQ